MAKISDYTAATTATGPEEIVGNQSAVTKKFSLTTIFSKIGTILASIGGDARGTDAVDFQFFRHNDDEVAGGTQSFIAGGGRNKISDDISRDKEAIQGHAEGLRNIVYDWQGHAEGNGCIADGKIAHAEGNNCVCAGNDAHAEGNRTFAGGRYYESVSTGSEDAGDGLGVKQFILIDDLGLFGTEGDVTSFFPNLLTDNLATRYGAGAQLDAKGNVYAGGSTPAVWTGDVPTTPNDLKWALHSRCYVRGPDEGDTTQVQICKSVYILGTGTKVYYNGDMPYGSIVGIYSSYAPQIFVEGSKGGNGQHSEGRLNSCWGDASHVEGGNSRAWGNYTHAGGSRCYALALCARATGIDTRATGVYAVAAGAGSLASGTGAKAEGGFVEASGDWSKAEGYQTEASERCAIADGERTVASGIYSKASGLDTVASGYEARADGHETTASGDRAHSEGHGTTASGDNAKASGQDTEAAGENSIAEGTESKALRIHEQAYSAGKRVVVGDDQTIRVTYSRTVVDVGWWEITVLDQVEDGKAYHFETMVMGRQTAGSGGAVGNTFAYKFQGCIQRDGAVYTTIGSVIRTRIGRSAGMSGDGLTTGERMYGGFGDNGKSSLFLQYGGVINQTYHIQTHSFIQEITV